MKVKADGGGPHWPDVNPTSVYTGQWSNARPGLAPSVATISASHRHHTRQNGSLAVALPRIETGPRISAGDTDVAVVICDQKRGGHSQDESSVPKLLKVYYVDVTLHLLLRIVRMSC